MNAWERIQHWLRIGRDDVVSLRDNGVINRYHEQDDNRMTNVVTWRMTETVMDGLRGKGFWDL